MAWTRSAGPGGELALAGSLPAAAAPDLGRNDQAPHRTLRSLTLASVARLAGLAIAAPLITAAPMIAVPLVLGLAVAYLVVARTARTHAAQVQPDFQLSPAPQFDQPTEPEFDSTRTNELAAMLKEVPFAPIEIRADLRADLMARVSHELRTPLNAVMGFSDLMGHQMFGPLGHPRYEEYVSHIRESSQKLLKSAEDTLAVTSLMAKSASRSDREPVSLLSLVKEAMAAMALDAGRRGIGYVLDVADDIDVVAHRRALRQALVNVLSEAVSRAAEGATITMLATRDLDKVGVTVLIDRIGPRQAEEHRSLPLCLAQTLLELDGARLIEDTIPSASWSVLLSLDAASQQDFFLDLRSTVAAVA